MEFFVGTLTREGGKGLLRCNLEEEKIVELEALSLTDPSYLIKVDGRVFSTSSDIEGKFSSCVNEISTDGKMKVIARSAVGGNIPCFLCPSPDYRFLYCANYGTGSISVFPVEGRLRECIQLVEHSGSGPHPTRQQGPHVHQVLFIPGTQYLCACDLGTDCIEVYEASVQTGMLAHHSTLHLHGGPRHLVFADDTLGYVCHELSNEVTVLRAEDGRLSACQTLSTLPEKMSNTASAIRLAPDQKRLYVSNRGHGSIAIYDVLADNKLHLAGFWAAGIFPRDFVLLKDGRILVADQRAGIRLLGKDGAKIALCEHLGAVCICC